MAFLISVTYELCSLTVDPALRPIPVVMLEHPWIHNMLKQEVDMARWMNQVWGWPKPQPN